jgi:hypothetical protein
MAKFDVQGRAASMSGPASQLAQVTPDDAADLPDGPCRGLFVGVAGALSVTDMAGATVALTSAACQYHPLRVARVNATGTTAGGIVALY